MIAADSDWRWRLMEHFNRAEWMSMVHVACHINWFEGFDDDDDDDDVDVTSSCKTNCDYGTTRI